MSALLPTLHRFAVRGSRFAVRGSRFAGLVALRSRRKIKFLVPAAAVSAWLARVTAAAATVICRRSHVRMAFPCVKASAAPVSAALPPVFSSLPRVIAVQTPVPVPFPPVIAAGSPVRIALPPVRLPFPPMIAAGSRVPGRFAPVLSRPGQVAAVHKVALLLRHRLSGVVAPQQHYFSNLEPQNQP